MRVNIEDSIYRDERFHKLSASEGMYRALGLCVAAWDLAHRWYNRHPERLIPLAEWAKHPELELLIKVGLAERRENGIYAKGSEKECDYLRQRSEAGRRGALKTNEILHGKRQQTRQITPSSSSSKKEKNNNCTEAPSDAPVRWDLDAIYREYPKRAGKSNKGKGLARLAKLIKSDDDYELAMTAVRRYKAHISSQNKIGTEFVAMFSSFWDAHGDWREWATRTSGDTDFDMSAFLEATKGTNA